MAGRIMVETTAKRRHWASTPGALLCLTSRVKPQSHADGAHAVRMFIVAEMPLTVNSAHPRVPRRSPPGGITPCFGIKPPASSLASTAPGRQVLWGIVCSARAGRSHGTWPCLSLPVFTHLAIPVHICRRNTSRSQQRVSPSDSPVIDSPLRRAAHIPLDSVFPHSP